MSVAHDAELAILRAQRDALAEVVASVWGDTARGFRCDSDDILVWMASAGLIEHGPDGLLQLSEFGRAALASVRR